MINLHERMLLTSAGVEPATSWSPVGRRIQLSHRGRHISDVAYINVTLYKLIIFNPPLYIISLAFYQNFTLRPSLLPSLNHCSNELSLRVSVTLRHLTNNVAKALHPTLSQTCQRLHPTGFSLPCRCDVTAKAAKQRWIRPEQTTNKKKEFSFFHFFFFF